MAEIMVEAAASKTMRELFETGQELRLQNAMVQSPLQTPSDPQHGVRRFFQPLVLEDGTTVPAPVHAGGSRRGRATSTPTGNGETIATVEDARWRQEPIARQTVATPARNALEDLKVIELTFAWAGPFMGRILGDHGAQVVKIESRRYPDTARGADLVDLSFGENDRWMDRSLAYIIANPAKYHVGMDLTDPAGKEVLLDLVRWADVIIENFTPRVLPNLGLGWDLFQSVNPSVIMISAIGVRAAGAVSGLWGLGLGSGVPSRDHPRNGISRRSGPPFVHPDDPRSALGGRGGRRPPSPPSRNVAAPARASGSTCRNTSAPPLPP